MVDMAERRVTLRSRQRFEGAVGVGAVAIASGVAAALAGTHATGTSVVDPLYAGILGAAVAGAGGIAGRATVLWLAAIAAGFSRGYEIFAAAAALLLAFASALPRRAVPVLGSLSAAVSAQVVLRWPHEGFQGATALLAAAALLPCLVSAVARLPRGARRAVVWTASLGIALAVVFCIPLAVEAAMSRTQASSGTTAAEDALRAVSDGDAQGGRAQLAVARQDFASVARNVDAWWTAGADLVPIVSQQRHAAVAGSQVARDVSVAAGDQADRINFSLLHYNAGGLDLAEVASLKAPLDQVNGQLTAGVQRLRSARSAWLVGPLESRLALLTSKVTKAQQSASLADEAAGVAPSLLGGQGARHYLVALEDPAESRGLGGLIVSYGVVDASGGHLSLESFQDISLLNTQLQEHGGGRITGPPDYLARYGQNPAQYLQNVTYSPDLPTVADVMNQLYREAGNPPLDGMMVLDPRALAALLNLSGPVQAPGIGQLTAANADDLLEKGQYAAFPSPTQQTARRNALDEAVKEALTRLTSTTLPGPLTLSSTLDPVVRSGDLLFWSTHPDEQRFLERIDMAGRFPAAAGGDLLGVVTSNSVANKVDAYLSKTVNDEVIYDPSSGSVSATVQVVLQNRAPGSGLSSEVIGNYAGSGLPPGSNRVWLTIYSPLQLVNATLGESPITFGAQPELSVEAYSAFVTIPPGTTATVAVRLKGRIAGGAYRLTLYEQPTVIPADITVDVAGTFGWKPHDSGKWSPTGESRAYRFFRFDRD